MEYLILALNVSGLFVAIGIAFTACVHIAVGFIKLIKYPQIGEVSFGYPIIILTSAILYLHYFYV